MKPLKVFVQEIKALARKGDELSLKAALNKATDALAIYPDSQTLEALIELLS